MAVYLVKPPTLDALPPHNIWPEYDCWSCEDTGLITMYDHSTDGITGYRPCEDPACMVRQAAARKRRQEEDRLAAAADAQAAAAHVCTEPGCCPPF